MGEVVGIVLGAGASTRLGRPKQTLRLGDRTLLGHVMAEVEASTLDRVVVVLGGAARDVRTALAPSRAKLVENTAYGSGCASSLLTGLDAAAECESIMLLLGDMPGVTADLVDEVLSQWRTRRPWAAVTSYRNGIGHPLVFSAGAFPALRELHGDKAVWMIVDREPEERVERLFVDRPRPLDVDTWGDYVAVCGVLGVEPQSEEAAPP
jgi:molybdenum cofactor cytidylyltransferase